MHFSHIYIFADICIFLCALCSQCTQCTIIVYHGTICVFVITAVIHYRACHSLKWNSWFRRCVPVSFGLSPFCQQAAAITCRLSSMYVCMFRPVLSLCTVLYCCVVYRPIPLRSVPFRPFLTCLRLSCFLLNCPVACTFPHTLTHNYEYFYMCVCVHGYMCKCIFASGVWCVWCAWCVWCVLLLMLAIVVLLLAARMVFIRCPWGISCLLRAQRHLAVTLARCESSIRYYMNIGILNLDNVAFS